MPTVLTGSEDTGSGPPAADPHRAGRPSAQPSAIAKGKDRDRNGKQYHGTDKPGTQAHP
jgi:hypothetical protein